jgi:hypothetical protein
MRTEAFDYDPALDLAGLQTAVQQTENVFGPLLAFGIDTARRRTVGIHSAARPIAGAAPSGLTLALGAVTPPGRQLVAQGYVYLAGSAQAVVAYR